MSSNDENLNGNKREKDDSEQKKSSTVNEFLDWVESFVFAIFLVLLVFIFLFRTVVVDGTSMLPTLEDGQRLLLSHFNYTPQRGDIIVANSPSLNKTIIKRCIGVEGDKVIIDYETNTITVNGEEIDESYLGEEMEILTTFDESYKISDTQYEYDVPDGCIFALGDNRNGSRDSRDAGVGFIDMDDVLGKAVLRFYPFDTFEVLS
ncbi:MAG: signal peptidase I [Ruminococcus sp.]|nr:signal peptidase I [Ruminococcus sp.]